MTRQIISEEKKCTLEDSDYCFIIIYDNKSYFKNKETAHKLAEAYRDDKINFFFVFQNDINME